MDLRNQQIKETYGNLATINTVAGTPTTGVLQNGAGSNVTALTLAGDLTATNVSATSLTGTLATAAQTNITSVGTLSSLTLGGDLTIPDKIIHSGDTNTAIRFPSADTVTAETAGTERLRVDSSGRILAGLTSTSDIARMVLQGNANLATDWCRVVFSRGDNTPTGTQYIGGLSFTDSDLIGGASIIGRKNGSGTWSGASKPTDIEFFTTPDGSSTLQSRMLIDSSGNVGIGTTSPSAKLDVRGSAIFNEDGADVDFRVEGDTDTHLIFADAGNDRVGIGTSSPAELLHVDGTIRGNLGYTPGVSYAQTSTSGTTSIVDTGIGFYLNRILEVAISGNPNSGGSAEYRYSGLFYVHVTTGFTGGAVQCVISETQVFLTQAVGLAQTITFDAVFWDGSSENTSISTGSMASNEIRLKIGGYNIVGSGQSVTIRILQ